MQAVPALLASLHHLSAFDDQGDLTRERAEAHDRAEQSRQQREHKDQQEIDRAAALRARRFQQAHENPEEAERRRAMQAAAARAREEEVERLHQAQQAKGNGPRPTTNRDPPPAPAFKYQVHACIAATSAEIARMIAESDAKTSRLRQDLATKRLEEAAKR
jgi:hypothetical protein